MKDDFVRYPQKGMARANTKRYTAYENVTATIQEITVRNVQVVFNQVVSVDDVQLGGKVFTQKQFQRHFERGQQLSLFE